MAEKTTYLLVSLSISNSNVDEITDEQVDEVISEMDYEFKNYEDYKINTEICGRDDDGQF